MTPQKNLNKCFICGASNWKKLYPSRDLRHNIEGDFWLLECDVCGLVATVPQLSQEEIEKFYPEDYVCFSTAIEEEGKWLVRADRQRGVRRRCDFVIKESGKKHGTVLDVGSATGIFLKGMKDYGWEVNGVEPSEFAAKYAVEQMGLNTVHGYLEEDTFKPESFDLVTFWDVFEHLPNPVEVLKIAHKTLKPNGVLVLSLPNSQSWDRRLFEDVWAGWHTPQHYYIFNQKNLTQLVEQHGYRFKRIRSFTGRHGAMAITLDYWLKKKKFSEGFRTNFSFFFNSYFGRVLAYPYFMLADTLNRSTVMTIVFVKK
jgi:2-polyprenyl-3-methyl-5-hydroxy-6-metoxy-1,4-benzoquinol methylase